VSPDDVPLGPFAEHLGIKITSIGPDHVDATWEVRPDLHQPFGLLHGGVHCAVVETLASMGGAVWFADRGQVVGVNNTTDFFRATTEGTMTSRAVPVHRGRSQQYWTVETTDAEGRLVSRGSVRLQNLTK
jgi:1,4-dihydroxy-2-naphthoyl-CoA hydrolase